MLPREVCFALGLQTPAYIRTDQLGQSDVRMQMLSASIELKDSEPSLMGTCGMAC